MSLNCFSNLTAVPTDAIFGLNELFQKDPRDHKINLTVGVFLDENGRLPLMKAVKAAEERLIAKAQSHAYKPMAGIYEYCQAMQKLVFGAESDDVKSGRICTVQTLGGTGALHLGSVFANKVIKSVNGVCSNPTWGNHLLILRNAGLTVSQYPYYDAANGCIDFDGMLAYLRTLSERSMVVLHACCHNPTGLDLTKDQWKLVLEVVKEKNLLPMLDMAYQGFGAGVDEDAYAPRLFASAGIPFMVASSCSKNFGLYGERVGALHVVTNNAEDAQTVRSILQQIVRGDYSNPPGFGASVVAEILSDKELTAVWSDELRAMRTRILDMRHLLDKKSKEAGLNLAFALNQTGMFSFTGLKAEQMDTLRDKYGVYAVRNGRICMAGLNTHNIDEVIAAIKAVL